MAAWQASCGSLAAKGIEKVRVKVRSPIRQLRPGPSVGGGAGSPLIRGGRARLSPQRLRALAHFLPARLQRQAVVARKAAQPAGRCAELWVGQAAAAVAGAAALVQRHARLLGHRSEHAVLPPSPAVRPLPNPVRGIFPHKARMRSGHGNCGPCCPACFCIGQTQRHASTNPC